MIWDQIVYNVFVPVVAALTLGIGGVWAAKYLGSRLGKDWSEHIHRK
jgi:hypothetical protein